MRIFDHPNMLNFTCPICGSSTDEPVVLIGKQWTLEDGNMEADQVHVSCLDLVMVQMPDKLCIVQAFKAKEAAHD